MKKKIIIVSVVLLLIFAVCFITFSIFFQKNYSIQGNTCGNIANRGWVASDGVWIYYVKPSDGYTIWKMKISGSDGKKVCGDSCYGLNIANGWIYYEKNVDYRILGLYKIRTDGSSKQKLTGENCEYATVLGDWDLLH